VRPISSFQLSERELRPGCVEIQVEGELDLAVADRLREALERVEGYEQVVVGLQRCEFIDSTGISVIVKAHTEMERQGRRVAIVGARDQVARVLSITGLDRNGLVYDSADEALTAFAPLAE
jgi:anti-anti-sigma factor